MFMLDANLGRKMPTDCIEWSGSLNSQGYGRLVIRGKEYRAHRIVWEETNGPIPDGMCVCHHCDNPPCVNVEHLFLGTPKDNTRDAQQKGRIPTAGHGTEWMYDGHKCRCEKCRLAKSRNWKERQARLHARTPR